ncbi:hypothetical protein [Clostridium botulinum]|uniref:hypothetical protein n=1 Tax=Clostridium botulinum TaxID=1491 RepID=UPI001E46CDA5|nr:hypothetical protein [Clostridium botulinum]MCD3254382.1 hypothetical protein [Clostridium botulinum C/D]MCD3279882.1 hypothetical protein [Clostridium botulinum C/D]MCD3339613.1 hypothetical protein [Clostridium botulinum C/D]MCD3357521.1 hypothetical protein [Clostridium botulinum C/D]
MNLVKAKREVLKTWRLNGTNNIIIKRKCINEYHEVTTPMQIEIFEGYYSKGKNLISINYTENASTNKNYNEIFSIIINENSKKIKRLDFFILNNVQYNIVDIENVSNIYFDLTLERC